MTIEAGKRYNKALCVRFPDRAVDELTRVAASRGMRPTEMIRAAVMALVRDPDAFPTVGLPAAKERTA